MQTYQPNAAYIILMDPHTGEILAMGSRPNYDPNNRKTFQPENVRNRCITDMVEPGSIFKIITLAAALGEHKVNLDTPIFCENGAFSYCGKILKDDEPHGWLPTIEVMAQSSNIGFAKIALSSLHEQMLYKYATAFGIGQRTGILHDQDESAGLLRPVSKWSALSITRIPMGQEVAATPIQLVTAMSVIANGGRLLSPRLTKQVTDETGRVMKVYQPEHVVNQVISADAAQRCGESAPSGDRRWHGQKYSYRWAIVLRARPAPRKNLSTGPIRTRSSSPPSSGSCRRKIRLLSRW